MVNLLLRCRECARVKTCLLTSGVILIGFVVVYMITLNPQLVVRKHKYLNIFHASDESEEDRNSINTNKCVPLQTTLGQTPICIYDPEFDSVISKLLDEQGVWETELLYLMASILTQHRDMQLIDIGSNIGVFTLQAAKIGHKVIAVDANKLNLRLLSKSLYLGGLHKHVTLVWNAVTDIHETINLTITTGNIGGSYVKSKGELNERLNDNANWSVHTALSITLEDMIGFVKGSPIFMKIDIEGSEWKALRGGELFFKEVNVRFILMEWGTAYKQGDKGNEIITHMHTFGFYPYEPSRTKPMRKLNIDNKQNWPYDVLWIKE